MSHTTSVPVWILALLRPHWRQALLAAIALLLGSLSWLALGQGVKYLVDQGFGSSNGSGSDTIDAVMLGILGLSGISGVAAFFRFYLMTWLGERLSADIRQSVYAHLLTLSPQFYQNTRTGEVISRFTSDTTVLQHAVGMSLSMALRSSVTIIGGLVMMLLASVELTLYVLLAVPAVLVPIKLLGKKVRRFARRSQDAVAQISVHVDESLHAIHTVQSYGHESEAQRGFEQRVEAVLSAASKRIYYRAWLVASVMTLSIGAITIVAWLGAHKVLNGAMSAGEISAFLFYALVTAGAVATISEVLGEVQRASGAGSRLLELLNSPVDIVAPVPATPLPQPLQGQLILRDLYFAYPSDPQQHALAGLNLQLQAGQRTAIVGPSGAGKSTLLQLLQQFYRPQRGQILLDGIDLATVDPHPLRQQFALVPQQPVIFASSVLDNIRYGRLEASDDEVYAAAAAANASEFIEQLSNGYHTELGERGVRLSGGQKQRIAIARAMLAQRPLLLLDEATSALDARSEQLVQQGLGRLMAGKTSLIIAHRLATVMDADRIVVLNQGRIEAIGTHQQLLQQSALYAELAQLQLVG
ncbi:ABC transporter transmembrane domain-containing protein [uncultured Ferrimonas sp.]|uniref:ABC transporter transmembrane domain-containing protein n=1 Tax=uncultured Ferrimonas sp. TaxID=432640 RepID=UPI0026210D97|nr:ABC transporter transmembrane domain-containing protein [uncultured Ferrimonas sp.]